MNVDVMCWLAEQIHASLRAWEDTHVIIFMVDAYKAHYSPRVLRAVAARRRMTHIIPAKTTWIMQPADTHLFSQYKVHLTRICQQEMLSRGELPLSGETRGEALVDTIEHVIHGRPWAHAFAQLGLIFHQNTVSARVWQKLGLDDPMLAGNSLPSLDNLLWFSLLIVLLQYGDLFAYFTRPQVSLPPPAVEEPEVVVVPGTGSANPWLGRLRSSSALKIGTQASADEAKMWTRKWRRKGIEHEMFYVIWPFRYRE